MFYNRSSFPSARREWGKFIRANGAMQQPPNPRRSLPIADFQLPIDGPPQSAIGNRQSPIRMVLFLYEPPRSSPGTTVTTIYLIRHGATVLSREDRFAGASDVALSDAGIQQAASLGRRLSSEKIAAVYCSDMHRTIHTAQAIAAPHQLLPIPKPALREINHGHWEGKLEKDVREQFSTEYHAWIADPLLSAPPGGETGLSVLARSLPELARIVAVHPDQIVAIVSHKATNRLLLCNILGIEPRHYRTRITQDTACLNVIEFRDAMAGTVRLMNDISHYATT